jgi:predicted HTH transcriptional regulator
MEQITHDELKKIIESRDLESLMGRAENIFFESSLEKYEMGKESKEAWKKGNLELAKDVCVFANSNGGIILIGLGERKSQKCLGNLVKEINCVDEGVADPDQYEKIIKSWVYPQI